MKNKSILSLIFVTSLILGSYGLFAQTAEELLPRAIQMEEVKGDLNEAIKTYQLIIDKYPENGKVCAEALLRMGNCYEKLGKTEAIKSYELLLTRYSNQVEQAKAARARLAVLKKEEPEGFRVQLMDFNMPEPFGLSPDGKRIVGVGFDKGQNIVVSHLDNDQVDYITDFTWENEYTYTYNPVWSPDGQKIVYTAIEASMDGSGEYSLRITDTEGQTRKLISSSYAWYAPNDWMPDGSSILTFKGDSAEVLELGLVPAEGGVFKTLVTLHGQVQNAGSSRAAATCSPDGRYVVYTDLMPGEESGLHIMDSEGKSSWSLCTHPAAEKWPRWSPDGNHIIFLSNRHGSWALWGVAVDQGKQAGDPFLIREGMGNNMFGNWTEHGLVSWNWVQMRDIFLMEINPETGEPKGEPRQLKYTPTGSNNHPEFAPDGNRIAFLRKDNESGRNYLVMVHDDQEKIEEFEIPEKADSRSLKWTPDGSGVAIHCVDMNENHKIKTYHFQTQQWESYSIPFPLWTFEWSGSGKTFYISRNGTLDLGAGIVEYDPATGEETYIYRPENNDVVVYRELRCSRDYSKLGFLETNVFMKVLDLQTGNSHTVAKKQYGYTSWSPDGEKILSFGARNPGEERKFISLFSASGELIAHHDLSRFLPEQSDIYIHNWSTDSSQVAFVVMQRRSEQMLYKNIIPRER